MSADKPRKPKTAKRPGEAAEVLSGPEFTEFLLYQTEDGQTRVEVRMSGETVWLNLMQMSELFGRHKSVISRHIRNVFEEGELSPTGTVANFATVQSEGQRAVGREIEHFNLDVIISVGYRVKSHRGTQFRIWATQRLREYLIKGFAMDDERLKAAGGGRYFDELLARIRDIRSAEKVFWRKVLDIYATKRPESGNANKAMVEEGISQSLRNQRNDEIPQLFTYAQLLLAVSHSEGRYGTTYTPTKFWARWREEEFSDAQVAEWKNRRLDAATQVALFAGKPAKLRAYFERLWSQPMLPTDQDRLLVALLSPARLLEFLRFFVLFDRKVGKIVARYQQFFGTFGDNAHARAWFGICRLVVGEADFAANAAANLVGEAFAIDQVVRDAVAENSLNPQNIESAIRKGLLPRLFGVMGLDRAKEAIDQIIQVTRVGLSRGSL